MRNLELVDDIDIPKDFSIGGWIYVLSNQYLAKNVYKIGMTTRTPEDRAKEISMATGVPFEFDVVTAFYSNNPNNDEVEIHTALKEFRFNEYREFFNCELEIILSVIREHGLIERGTPASHIAMNYDFFAFRNEIDKTDEMVTGNFDIFGSYSAVKNFLMEYGIESFKKDIARKNVATALSISKARLIKKLTFQHGDMEKLQEIITENNKPRKVYREF